MPKEEQSLTVAPTETEGLELAVLAQGEKREILLAYAADHMILGTDYHEIQGRKSLGKPGAEKICSLFGVTIGEPELAQDFFDALPTSVKDRGAIVIKTKLYRNGEYVGAGIGARALGQDQGDLNKSMKMARKSSVIDAVISSFGLSDLFTQDIEDMGLQDKKKSAVERTASRHPAPTEKEYEFTITDLIPSTDKKGRPYTRVVTDLGTLYDWSTGYAWEGGMTYKALIKGTPGEQGTFASISQFLAVVTEEGDAPF